MVPAIVYLFLIFLFIFISVESLRRPHVKKTPKKNMPPGPWKLPVIGNLHQLSSSVPHISLEYLAKRHGPIMHLQLGKVPVVIISSKEIAEHILKKEGITFAERPIFTSINGQSSFFSPYSEKWREMRKIYMTHLLSKQRVQSFKVSREDAVWDFMESIFLTSGKPFNFSEKIYEFLYSLNYRIIFGKRRENHDHLVSLLNKQVELAVRLLFFELIPSPVFLMHIRRLKSEYKELDLKILAIFEDTIRECKAERRERSTNSLISGDGTLVDSLLKIQEHGNEKVSITDNDMKHAIKEVFGGGSETTATTLEWAMSELIINPNMMTQARDEVRKHLKGKKSINEEDIEQLKYLKSIIKETLRFHPPGTLLPRISREKCEISGYEIPEKTPILINLWALARDPKYWVSPDEFKPERFRDLPISFQGMNFEFIPFGGGRRMCPGITYAVANIELLLAQLLYHFDWKLQDGLAAEALSMTAVLGAGNKRKDDLYLIASPVQFDQGQGRENVEVNDHIQK